MTGRPRPPTWSRPWPRTRLWPTRSTCRSRSPGPNAQRQIQQINAMVQAGAEAIVVFPISPTALNQAVKNACDKGVMVFAYDARDHRALRLQRLDRPGGGRPRHGRMAGQEAQWQGQYRRDHRRARHLGRHAAHQGGEGSLRQASRHQDRRRSGRHVEPGGRPHRTVEDPRDAQLGRDRRAVDAGRLLHRQLDAARSRQEAGAASALRRRRLEWRPHPDAAGRHRGRRLRHAPMRRWARRASPMPRRPIPARWR